MITQAQLDREVPRWREAIHDPRWPQWLRWIDPETGMRRSELMELSNEQAIWLIHQFISTDGWMPPPRPAAPGPVYSRADIKSAYDRRRRGQYPDDEWQRFETDLAAALRESRVSGGLPIWKNLTDSK
jgi:hypothetical protein